jgi:hypothetical protein
MKNNKINSSPPLRTAILLIIFNRPSTTIQVFKKIRQAKPLRLYVASDGPRVGHASDKENVIKTREIITKIDWPCEVKTLFRDKNLGCKKAVSGAITWFFENEEQGIVLEDDCVPHLDFFTFCENLLERYAKDVRVSVITGNNFQNGKWRGDASYYFSKYPHCWGWATWRRAWNYYQEDLKFWPEWSNSKALFKYVSDKVERKYWQKIFDLVYAKKFDSTWDYTWVANIWYKNGLTVTPNVNLVSNIGYGENATHTHNKNSTLFNMLAMELSHIIHPKQIIIDAEADRFAFDNHFRGKYLRFPYNWFIFPYRIFNYIFRKIITR